MKNSLFLLILLLISSVVRAQQNGADSLAVIKFTSYYNTGKTDSIYALFGDEIRVAMPITALNTGIQQVKSAFGNIIKAEYFKSDQRADTYIGTMERSGPVLYLNFNKSHRIVGFFVSADKRELPGTVTATTPTSTLKGILSMPATTKKIPVVLLIAGSGPTDRNGNNYLIKGKPNYFLQLSEGLNGLQIAVLRYDKRGIGQSTMTKTPSQSVFEDNVEDALAFIRLLKADKRFSKVIVAGHSEGSLVGMLACEREKVDKFISLAGPGFDAATILKTQLRSNNTADDYKTAVLIVDSVRDGESVKQILTPALKYLFDPSLQCYLHSWMQYDPSKEIAKLNIPILIVQGTNDIQVSIGDAQRLKKAKPTAQLKLIDGMSHILKPAPADRLQNFDTYSQSNLSLHPQLIPILSTYINSNTK